MGRVPPEVEMADVIAKKISDTRKAERRRAARIAFAFVEAISEQEQVEFHAGKLKDEILGKQTKGRKK
jgi:hypothetical protein